MKIKYIVSLLLLFISISTYAENSAAIPAEREGKSHGKWIAQHKKHKAFIQSKKPVDLLMIGDSITACWLSGNRGKNIWEEYYAKRNAFNIGISGDTTQGVLWRLQNGAIENISPKLAILMIGTNNHKNTSEEVAGGIKVILEELKKRLPKTKILLLDILPRGQEPTNTKLHLKNMKTNKIIKKYADNKTVFSIDINHIFLNKDRTLNMNLMKDPVHPNEAGYKVWAEAMEPMIEKFIGKKK